MHQRASQSARNAQALARSSARCVRKGGRKGVRKGGCKNRPAFQTVPFTIYEINYIRKWHQIQYTHSKWQFIIKTHQKNTFRTSVFKKKRKGPKSKPVLFICSYQTFIIRISFIYNIHFVCSVYFIYKYHIYAHTFIIMSCGHLNVPLYEHLCEVNP